MGKASQLDKLLDARPLTAEEIRLKRLAAQISDDDIEVGLDGTLRKGQRARASEIAQRARASRARAPEVVHQAEPNPWD